MMDEAGAFRDTGFRPLGAVPPVATERGAVPIHELIGMYAGYDDEEREIEQRRAAEEDIERALARIDTLSIGELKSLRRRFAFLHHPDRSGSSQPEASGRMASVNSMIDKALQRQRHNGRG